MVSNPFTLTIRTDLYTKIVLTAIAVFLGVLALQPIIKPISARAQSDSSNWYIEPGVTTIRKSDGSYLGDGKIVIDRKTGDIWGFPTFVSGALYPVDPLNSPATSKPTFLGRFDFSAMKKP
jgi:hypothetical protein